MMSFKPFGSGFIVLQVIRLINLLILTLVAISCVVLMVVAEMPGAFTFFNDVGLAFVVGVCLVFIISELGLCRSFFADNFPVISQDRGFTWLGIGMIIMGAHTLGQLSDSRYSQATMPLPFWRLCLAGGILTILFGFINILASFVYGRSGVSARMIRSAGATNTVDNNYPDAYSTRSDSIRKEKPKGNRFTGLFNKSPKPKPKPQISHPIVHGMDHDVESAYGANYEASFVTEDPIPASRESPMVPGLERPPTALHPALLKRFTQFSEASHLPRF